MDKADASSRRELALAALTGLVALFAIVLQYVLLLARTWHGKGPLAASVQFLSYFTILSNIGVLLVATAAASRSTCLAWFATPRMRGAIALYIGVTGAIYVTILRTLWSPTGWQWLADSSLHYAVPVLYLVLWLSFWRRRALAWSDAIRWMAFPLIYLAWALARGAWVGEYPYPFLDAANLGYARVVVNALGVTAVFVVLAFVLIAVERSAATRAAEPARAL
jgi:hypothetical protein